MHYRPNCCIDSNNNNIHYYDYDYDYDYDYGGAMYCLRFRLFMLHCELISAVHFVVAFYGVLQQTCPKK